MIHKRTGSISAFFEYLGILRMDSQRRTNDDEGTVGYFGDTTAPEISNSTSTTGFTLSRKLLGSLMPHCT